MRQPYRRGKALVGRLTTKKELSVLQRLFDEAAKKKGWVVPSDFSAFDAQSVWWAAHVNDMLVGGIQLTLGGHTELPFEHVWPDYAHLKRPSCGEITLLAMRDGNAHPLNHFLLLSIELFRYCDLNKITYLFTAITDVRRRQYRALGCPFIRLTPERIHWGYPSYLLGVSIEAVKQSLAKQPNQRARRVKQQWYRNPERS